MKTISNTKKFALATVAALGAASFAMSAHADESMQKTPTVTVRYSDLNINTQAGAEVLYKRIRNAAEQVCGGVDPHRLMESAAAKACVDRAMSGSVREVNSLRLTRIYDEHSGTAKADISVASLR